LLVIFYLAGCQGRQIPQEGAFLTPEFQIPAQNSNLNEYPGSPEGVVQAFLKVYPETPVDAVQYLAPSLVSQLNEQTILKLLPGNGIINGFLIVQGAASAETERSQLTADIEIEGKLYQAEFHLITDQGYWRIDQIIWK
jgi:hypothetical protein